MKAKISSGKGGGGKGGGDKKFSRDPDEKKDKHYFNDGVGTPGDFRFSDVPKPEDYLHTFEPICFLFSVFLAPYRFFEMSF